MSGLGLTSSRKPLSNQYVSHCKVCNTGVYDSQDWQWATQPMGISHTDCSRHQSPFDRAALAPLKVRRRDGVPIDLYPTPYRKYLAGQIREGRVRWHPRLGWRLHAQDQKPQTQNANVRDMVRAGWATEAGDALERQLTLTELGERHAAAKAEVPDGT